MLVAATLWFAGDMGWNGSFFLMGAVNKKKIPTTKKSPKALKQNQEGGSVEGFLSVPVVKMASSQTTSYVDRKTFRIAANF